MEKLPAANVEVDLARLRCLNVGFTNIMYLVIELTAANSQEEVTQTTHNWKTQLPNENLINMDCKMREARRKVFQDNADPTKARSAAKHSDRKEA